MSQASKTKAKTTGASEVQPLRSMEVTGKPVPTRVLLAPWGQVESINGSFLVDEESADLAVRAFNGHGTDIPIDYEHQTLGGSYSSPNGQAPAAGWIKQVFAEPGVGLLAEIEWTDQARQMLSAKEYRYLSPVAVIRKSDRKLVAIHSAALTNKPAIVGMEPIVNSADTASTATATCPLDSLRHELDLPVDAEAETVLLAAGQRIAELESQATARHVGERVREAVRTGKLVEAQRAWAEALVAKEEGLFDEWLRTAPVIVRTGAIPAPTSAAHAQSSESVRARARAEYRSYPLLARITTEEAFVGDALRQHAA